MNDLIERLKPMIKDIKCRNNLDFDIADKIKKPVTTGSLGEYIASEIFGIDLEDKGSNKGFDGRFRCGDLGCKDKNKNRVNVKWYTVRRNILSLHEDRTPDYYLVLSGPRFTGPSKGVTHPLRITNVYLFEKESLFKELCGRRIGNPTSVRNDLWDAAEIFPEQRNECLPLNCEQRAALKEFEIDDKQKEMLDKMQSASKES